MASFVLWNGYWFVVNGTTLDHTLILPPGSDAAFSPAVYAIAERGHYLLSNATITTLCSTITDYLHYYGGSGPGANRVKITVLGPYSFKLNAYKYTSPTNYQIQITNTTYNCDPSLDESTITLIARGSWSSVTTAVWYQASLMQRSTNVTVQEGSTWGTGPGYNEEYVSVFNGSTWPVEGLRLAHGDYELNCGAFEGYGGFATFAAVDASRTPTVFTVGPNASLSLSNAYLHGMCAKAVGLPRTLISFTKSGNSSSVSNKQSVSHDWVLPLAAPLWPMHLEPPTSTSVGGSAPTNAGIPTARLYANGSTIFVSGQEASTLHYLTALQPHALALAGDSARAVLLTQGVTQLAQAVLGLPAATAMLQQYQGDGESSPDFSHLEPNWHPPANLSAEPVFASYSILADVVRVAWSPTPNGGAMRDTTIGAMEPTPNTPQSEPDPDYDAGWQGDPGVPDGMQGEPSWLPYSPATNTYLTSATPRYILLPTFCDTGAPLANFSASLFSPPLLTVGGLSPTTPNATRAALLANSNYYVDNFGDALAAASSWVHRVAAGGSTNGSASYLPPVVLIFEDSTINGTVLPLEVRGAIIVAGPVPPPPGLPTDGNMQLVPGLAVVNTRPNLDLANTVNMVRIVEQAATTATGSNNSRRSRRLRQQSDASTNNGANATAPFMLLQRLKLTNLSAQPLEAGQQPLALPLWAFGRLGRTTTTVPTTATTNNNGNNTNAQLVLTSVTVQLPVAEFAALCALARLAAALPPGLQLSDALHALRTSNTLANSPDNGTATDWATTTAMSLSPAATAQDVLVAALFHMALDGVSGLGSPTITNLPTATDTTVGDRSTISNVIGDITTIDNIIGGINTDNNATASAPPSNATNGSGADNNTGDGNSPDEASNNPNNGSTNSLQLLHLGAYEGWAASGVDVTFVPDAPLASLELILAADVGLLLAAATGASSPASPSTYNPPIVRSIGGGSSGNSSNTGRGDGSGSSWRTVGAEVGVVIAASVVGIAAVVGAAWMLHRVFRRTKPGANLATQLDTTQDHIKVFVALGPPESRPSYHAPEDSFADTTEIASSACALSQQTGCDALSTRESKGPDSEIHALLKELGERRGRHHSNYNSAQTEAEVVVHAGEQLVLRAVLGRGAGGTVYEGSWKDLTVAVKAIIIPGDAPMANKEQQGLPVADRLVPRFDSRQRAVNEAAVCCSLAHPNVVTTYHYELSPVVATAPNIVVAQQQGADGGQAQDWKLYLVQELCDASLADTLPNLGGYSSEAAPLLAMVLVLLRDVASGMAYLHSRDIIHGDLKPDNVLLQLDPSDPNRVIAKVTDFGLCVTLDPAATHISNYAAGTPFYVAPEVLKEGRLTKASDVYSFGVLAWQALVGITPWTYTANGEYIYNEDFWTHAPAADVPANQVHFKDICRRCMSQEPRSRPTFEEVLKAFEALKGQILAAGKTREPCG